MSRTICFLAAVAALGLATSASANTVFTDGFGEDALGAPVSSLTNFNIAGTVDVVGASNPFGIVATSNVVDLDGSPGPGEIVSKQTFSFNAGDTVTFSAVLGGAQRGSVSDDAFLDIVFGGSTIVNDQVGTGLFSSFGGPDGSSVRLTLDNTAIAGDTPFTLSTFSFVAGNSGTLQFGLGSRSADNVGPLLDSVSLDVVPEPATWALMISGFGLAGAALRRRRQVSATA